MLFKEIPGQTDIKERLIRSVLTDRISHAQLFAGSSGRMKLPLAVAYARFICCINRQIPEGNHADADACGTCPACVKYNNLAHPDLHFIFPVTTTKTVKSDPLSDKYIAQWRALWKEKQGIFTIHQWHAAMESENKQPIIYTEDCQQIIRKLSYKSYESEYKVMIIWLVEKMNHSAAPRILKILEEPPDKTLFILVAEETSLLLSTILSRSQIITFPALKTNDIHQWLVKKGIEDASANRIALLSEGNAHKALELATSDATIQQHFTDMRQWLRYCFKPQATINELVEHSETLAAGRREQQKRFLSYCYTMIHYTFKAGITGVMPAGESDEAVFIRNLAPFVHQNNIYGFKTLFEEAIYHIERNANPKVLFIDVSLKIVQLIKQPK